MANIQYHYNRRPRNFLHRKVREALPEFFTQDYPNLVTFLEKYYDYLDSDGASSFDLLNTFPNLCKLFEKYVLIVS